MNITGSPQELLWQYQTAIAKAGAGTVLAYIVVTTALYSAADILMVEDGVYLLISIVGWALGYLLLRYLMKASAAPGETSSRTARPTAAPTPLRRQPASVLAPVKGARDAPAGGRP